MPNKRILLVDYDPKILNHTREVLEGAGFYVSTCADGLAALDQFKVLSPDLVLLSAMLPKMHGFEVCSNIRKIPGGEKTPVVLITDVYKGKRYRVDAINKYGATEYIERPIEDNGLVTILKELIKDDLGFNRSAEHHDEKTVQFTTDMFSHMVKEVPIGGVKTLGEKKNVNEKPKSTDAINKKLEESLAGLELEVSKKTKAKAKADSSSIDEKPAGASDSTGFTSEDLFTDVIASVERELQSEKVFEHLENNPEEMTMSEPTPAPEPKVAAPEPPVPPAAPKPSAPPKPAAVKSADKKISFDDEIEKKLSSTLSGLVKDKTKPAPPKVPPKPQAPKVETPAPAEMKQTTAPVPAASAAAKPEMKPEPVAAKVAAPVTVAKEGVDFGQYLLLGKVATGGMAELFKAKRKGPEGFEKILAIKRILPHMSDNEDFVTMFIDEAKLAARLTHHNICQIFDLGKIDNSYYIAMEFVHGRDLRAALKAARNKNVSFPIEIAVLITSKIASALDYAHRKRSSDGQPLNLVHRDVSPQNILISYEGEVKLVDFGIAKAATKAHQTQHGALKGKLLYMSPEQAWGRNVDKRSDLFSLGAILYEMLTGHPLFFNENDTEVTILEKVREAKITPLRELNSRVPAELEKITSKALRKNPDDRYQQASEMQADLDKLFYSEGYNATSAALATFIRSLFPEDWAKEGGARDVEKPVEQAPVGAIAEAPARLVPEKPAAAAAPVHPPKEKEAPRREKEAPVFPKTEPVAPKIEAPKPSGFRDITAPEIMAAAQPKKSSKTLLLGVAAAVVVAILAYVLFRPKAEQPAATNTVVQQKAPQPVSMETEKGNVPQPAPSVTPPAPAQDQKQQEKDLKQQEAEAKKLAEEQAAEEARKKEEEKKKQEQAKLDEEQRLAQQKADDERRQQEEDAARQQEEAAQQVAQVQQPPVQEQPQPEPVKEPPKAQPAPAQQPSVKDGDLVELGPGVTKPELTSHVNPVYPPAAQKKGVEGTVIISVLVSESGNVADVKVLRQAGGSSGLNEAAVAAARKWKFRPAVKEGKRVKVWVTYPIVFKMH